MLWTFWYFMEQQHEKKVNLPKTDKNLNCSLSRSDKGLCASGSFAFRLAHRLLFCSHPRIGNIIISSPPWLSLHKAGSVSNRGARLSRGSGLALESFTPSKTRFRVAEYLNPAALPPTSALSGFRLGWGRKKKSINRSHVRKRGLRHQRGHRDPLRHGAGQEGEGHRRADESAQLPVHGRQSHLLRRA